MTPVTVPSASRSGTTRCSVQIIVPSRRTIRSCTDRTSSTPSTPSAAHDVDILVVRDPHDEAGVGVEVVGFVAQRGLHRRVHVVDPRFGADGEAVHDIGRVLGQDPEALLRRLQRHLPRCAWS